MIRIKVLLVKALILFTMLFISGTAYSVGIVDCTVDSTWLTNPSLPSEVKMSDDHGTSSNFCDFYQFSTQTYLYLMSPSSTEDGKRNFQVHENYPLLEFNGDGTPANACDDIVQGVTLRAALNKSSLSTEQAGSHHATIYAQDGNVIYYDVRFDRKQCSQTASAVEMQKQSQTNFNAGTTELKFAWKKLSSTEISSKTFVTQKQDIKGVPVTLGLVGMHIAVATKNHPEFVWATYEHKLNSPDCTPSDAIAIQDWMFASQACTAGLPATQVAGNACAFNQSKGESTAATGTPTNICRVNPYGTNSKDLKASKNISDIEQQNSGMLALFNQSETPVKMKRLKNYFNVGALWLSDITKDSGEKGVPNERGSLRLANTVAETEYQNVDTHKTFASNCFGCHNYKGSSSTPSNNITSQELSHIFRDIKFGQGLAIDVTAPFISSNAAAPAICNSTCENLVKYNNTKPHWNNEWTNINVNASSVCGCTLN